VFPKLHSSRGLRARLSRTCKSAGCRINDPCSKTNVWKFIFLIMSLAFDPLLLHAYLILRIFLFHRLQRFEKTNEMLINCNALSAGRLQTANAEFKKHSQLLMEMKKDLDGIFKRTRALKTKLSSQYPQAFAGNF
jgi:Uncharacterized conserved protein